MRKFLIFIFLICFTACNSNNKTNQENDIKTNINKDLAGYKIVFESPQNNIKDQNTDIWIMNPDGSETVNLTPGDQGSDQSPEWGPFSDYIYYASTQHNGEAYELYRVNTAGTPSPVQITDLGRDVRSISVSPDNRIMALSIMSGSSKNNNDLSLLSSDLYILSIETVEDYLSQNKKIKMEDLQLLISSPQSEHIWYSQPQWSPIVNNDPWLAYTKIIGYGLENKQKSIWIIKSSTNEKKLIVENDSMSSWTPKGESILTFDFNEINVETTLKKKLKIDELLESAGTPAASPDGKYVLFKTDDTDKKTGLAYLIYSDETKANPYETLSTRYADQAKWSPTPVLTSSDKIKFTKKIEVFGIPIKATLRVPDEKLKHAAAIMAEYLDNNEDGSPDNNDLIKVLIEEDAILLMYTNEKEIEAIFKTESEYPENSQDLQAHETHPEGSKLGAFDASIEEILHLITHVGYSKLNTPVFGEEPGSSIANAMDIARGGYFDEIPDSYPDGAWYTYDDDTCDYSCQVTEYTYWALTSILGAQEFTGRYEEIKNEWKLNTKNKVETTDKTVYDLLVAPENKMPNKLPDGKYNGSNFTIQKIQ